MPATSKSRLEARLTDATYALLKRAAEVQGRSLSDFVVSAASQEAYRVIATQQVVRLSVEDQHQFAAALLAPPEPNAALSRARERHRRLLKEA